MNIKQNAEILNTAIAILAVGGSTILDSAAGIRLVPSMKSQKIRTSYKMEWLERRNLNSPPNHTSHVVFLCGVKRQ